MLIHNAGSFGLADLYQLRGRVGRAADQAWCYLLVNDPSSMSEQARKRIQAIERFSELASGFNLAAMDLEIRGAGNVLGAEQSGHMASVGYDLFMDMLRDAINELSGEETGEKTDTELKYSMEARIPPDFIPDDRLRLRLYRRLSSASDLAEVSAMAAELTDRFGGLPLKLRRLIGLMRLKVLGRSLDLRLVWVRSAAVEFTAAEGFEDSITRLEAAATAGGYRVSTRGSVLKVLLPKGGVDPIEAGEALLRAASVDGT